MKDVTLDSVIEGRVEPHIYAFSTGTIPNYLKIGDTHRTVARRLNEWKEHYPDLVEEFSDVAKVSDDTYYRDFSVHFFIENELMHKRLERRDLRLGEYYSKEFFKNTTVADVKAAISDINSDYIQNGGKYQFYNADSTLPETYTYQRVDTYDLRPNQADTVDLFDKAVKAGRTNLLMYAVMRFGKSFTSMCCALKMNANIVVIVSAKADVKEEWKKTIQSHIKFEAFEFLDGDILLSDENAIKETISHGKRVAVFLTLQDLQGETIKEKHKEVFENQIDLLIIDETHFGARAGKFGSVLREQPSKEDLKARVEKYSDDDYVDGNDANNQISKALHARIKLHLSGTPYRILMSSEFSKEDIIAFYQFSDIAKDQETWDKDNKENVLAELKNEWDNPYFGFPQMLRFAFNPNESSRKRLDELQKSGVTYAFSALLKPKSITRSDDNSHTKFVYEKEVLELLEVIDGSKSDESLLGFLDLEQIKKGKMCQHIVMVLPYCASCDAMEKLIQDNHSLFKNLNDYEIINISGHNVSKAYNKPQKIKKYIKSCEAAGKKTLTLTVNRMLTGSTVEEWDTMIFLKDTASPQEYDQAIFRLQNQYVKKFEDDKGNTIKVNMKPQTLLVDFDPNRMFTMQEQKAQIYNVNVDEAGNSKLEERIKEELRISPIIVMNHDSIEQVEASDILDAVSEYSKSRGVAEETLEIPVDLSLMDIEIIKRAIEQENEIGSKSGLTIKSNKGDGTELDLDDNGDSGSSGDSSSSGDSDSKDGDTQTANDKTNNEDSKNPVKQFRSYYARILFFSFLTQSRINSLEQIIAVIDSDDNYRIAKNINISKDVLSSIFQHINKFILRDLDYKIHNLNKLSKDTSLDPIERATVAVQKFGKLGESEVITPKHICDSMVGLIPNDAFALVLEKEHRILDVAGKAGEFAISLVERYQKLGFDINQIKNAIFTIPTSGLTYEFTRMIYGVLGLNTNCIAERFNAYSLLKKELFDDKDDFSQVIRIISQDKQFNEISMEDSVDEGDKIMKFDIVVGNPPYQEIVSKSAGNKSLGKQLFPSFIKMSTTLAEEYASLITPSKWFTSDGQDGSFVPLREYAKSHNHFKYIRNFSDNTDIFAGVSLGAVNYFLYDKSYSGNVTFETDSSINKRPLFEDGVDIIISMEQMVGIVNKVRTYGNFASLMDLASGRDAFGIPGKKEYIEKNTKEKNFKGAISVRCAYEVIRYIDPQKVSKGKDYINHWKIFTSKGNGAAGTIEVGKQNAIIGKAYVAPPNSACSDSLIPIGMFDTEEEAVNLAKYMSTKFLRFMVGVMKSSRNIYQVVYRFVPIQDFTSKSDIDWSKGISDIDAQLYSKYALSQEEIDFIESTIKPMNNDDNQLSLDI